MGEPPKTEQEVIQHELYNGYLYRLMKELELKHGIVLHKLPDFNELVYGDSYKSVADNIVLALVEFRGEA